MKIADYREQIRRAYYATSFDPDRRADLIICIIHEERPSAEVISALKGRGFHWSPKNKYWCRKHTGQALVAAKQIVGVK